MLRAARRWERSAHGLRCNRSSVEAERIADDIAKLRVALQHQGLMQREVERRPDAPPGNGAQSRAALRPTLDIALGQPAHVSELGHETLAKLAMLGNHNAHRERLLREIMAVDSVTWVEAHEKLAEMDRTKERYYWLESLPYRVGITSAIVCSVAAPLMVFSKPVATWYAVAVVSEELPKNLAEMTINQVGTWTWTWMEPMIGTASFALLCAQFARAQVSKMNMKPYTEIILEWKANRLAESFPQYDRSMVRAWAKHMPSVRWNFLPKYESDASTRGPTSGL